MDSNLSVPLVLGLPAAATSITIRQDILCTHYSPKSRLIRLDAGKILMFINQDGCYYTNSYHRGSRLPFHLLTPSKLRLFSRSIHSRVEVLKKEEHLTFHAPLVQAREHGLLRTSRRLGDPAPTVMH